MSYIESCEAGASGNLCLQLKRARHSCCVILLYSRYAMESMGIALGAVALFVMLLSCGDVLAQGLLRHSDLAMAGVSEALSHSDSATTLYSSDNYLKCTSSHHVAATSTLEISELILRYTSRHEPVKIRATRRGFHSSAGFVCPGRRGSTKPEFQNLQYSSDPISVTVLMHLMNRVVAVDPDRNRLTVEAGMTLLELVNAAEANAMSVPVGAVSIYANLTVGGVILASAHGSGFGAISSLGDLVTAVKWVDGNGEIILSDLETGVEEVRALVGGLGLLGIATEFTLQLQAISRTIVEVRKGLSDDNIVADLMKTLTTETPHVIAFWRPDFGTYKMVMFSEENEKVLAPTFYPNGKIAYFTKIDEETSRAWDEIVAKWEEDAAEESASADVMNADVCNLANIIHNVSMFEDGEGNLLEHATIPTNYAVVSDDCSPQCIFHVHHMGLFAEDTEFTIKISQFEDWVADAKRIVRAELADMQSRMPGAITRCMPPGYFWLRFGKGNQNLLSTATGTEDVVYVQWAHLHSARLPNKLAKQSTIAETLEQMTLCKHRGRPHWGKNHERVFRHPECKVRDNFPAQNIATLMAMQQVHDPRKMFEPELFHHLLEKTGPEYSELCTAHFWCYCELDSHCPQGHACRPSASFPLYKICQLVDTSHEEL